jgi:hypothetical protein
MVRYLVSHSITDARFVGRGAEATADLFNDAGGASGGVSALVVWLADAISTEPRPDLFEGLDPGGVVVIEATLSGDEDLVPVLVETNRAVLRSADGESYRRIEFTDQGSFVQAISPVAVVEIESNFGRTPGAFRLVRRHADTTGGVFSAECPAHLSWFRHNLMEPASESGTS